MKQDREQHIKKLFSEADRARKAGDDKKAEQKLKECIALDDGDPAPSKEKILKIGDVYVASHLYSSILMDQGRYEKAIRAAQRALLIKPVRGTAYWIIAECHKKLKKYIEAEEAYRKSIKAKPYPETYYSLAHLVAKYFLDREKESLIYINKCLELDPFYEAAYSHLGYYYLRQNNDRQALRHYEATILLDPSWGHPYSMLGMARYYLLKQNSNHPELVELVKILQKAIELDPAYFMSYLRLADIYCRMERYQTAHNWYQQALKIAPQESVVHRLYGNFLACKGVFGKAEYHCRKALEIKPNCRFGHFALGRTLLYAERFSEARKQLEIAEKLGHHSARKLIVERIPAAQRRK